ncbi:hypothetical protein V1478_005860 [Vespula squamosa]|uniref:Uncharacterized protein n=1 Tax=Vespula squamosa TaxID=30214 RepID=A0ABD2BA66_VESSQ
MSHLTYAYVTTYGKNKVEVVGVMESSQSEMARSKTWPDSKNSTGDGPAADVISGARLENGDHVSLENSILARVATNRRRRRSTNPAPVSVRQRRFSRAATVES